MIIGTANFLGVSMTTEIEVGAVPTALYHYTLKFPYCCFLYMHGLEID